MEGTHPRMDEFIHKKPEPLAPLRVPCCFVTAGTGVDRQGNVLVAQVTCPLHRPCQGLCWAGNARVDTWTRMDTAGSTQTHTGAVQSLTHACARRCSAPNPLAAGPWGGGETKGSHQSNKSLSRHPDCPLPGP